MRKTKSAVRAKAEFVESATGMYERLRAWRKENPRASFDEIAAEVGKERRRLMGGLLGELATQGEESRSSESVKCGSCGGEMVAKGHRGRGVSDPAGEVGIERGYYYHCPACGSGFFSPGR